MFYIYAEAVYAIYFAFGFTVPVYWNDVYKSKRKTRCRHIPVICRSLWSSGSDSF
jgi:hypothetical protein